MKFLKVSGQSDRKNLYAYFAADVPGGTTLQLFAERFYELRINGKLADYGPAKTGKGLYYFDEHALPQETNPLHIALKLHNRSRAPRLWARLLDADGREIAVDWQCQAAECYTQDAPELAGFVGFGEYCDCTSAESSWYSMPLSGTPEIADEFPESWLILRTIPALERKKVSPLSLTRQSDGSFLADFGSFVYGRYIVSGRTASGGTLNLKYVEDLKYGWANQAGKPFMYADKLFLGKGAFAYTTFNKRSGRYFVIDGVDDLTDLAVEVENALYPLGDAAEFHCSDEKLEKIWQLGLRTLRVCCDDLINDCPHRDQAQWMDAFATSQSFLAVNGAKEIIKKAVLQHAISSFDHGRFLSPSMEGKTYFADFALVEILYILWYYKITADKDFVQQVIGNARKAVANFDQWKNADHLLENPPPETFVYLDNAFELYKGKCSAGFNALYYGALSAMAELEKVIGGNFQSYLDEAALVRESFHRCFDHPRHPGCLRDAVDRYEHEFMNLNFCCELGGKWHGSGARAEFVIYNQAEGNKNLTLNDVEIHHEKSLLYGSYANSRVYLNGELLCTDKRSGFWGSPAPCYRPNRLVLDLLPGKNILTFDVQFVHANWDLFFDLEGFELKDCTVCEIDFPSGRETSERFQTRARRWLPPELSQTTHGYAGICGLLNDSRFAEKLTPGDYPRNYISVRVPLFSRECPEGSEPGWVLPGNTPWTQYHFITSLFKANESKRAIDMLRTSWGSFLDFGAVDAWEEFNRNSSLCHGWGSMPVHFAAHDILGVKHESFAEKGSIDIVPDLCGLKYASGKVALNENSFASISLEYKNDQTLVKIQISGNAETNINLNKLKNPVLLTE